MVHDVVRCVEFHPWYLGGIVDIDILTIVLMHDVIIVRSAALTQYDYNEISSILKSMINH